MTEGSERSPSHLLVVLRMGEANFLNHVLPILSIDSDVKLTIVRPEPPPPDLADPRIEYVDCSSSNPLLRIFRTLMHAMRLGRAGSIQAILSFNAVPYGMIATFSALRAGKPCHVGFVGTDAHRLERKAWGRLIDRLLRRAHLFTVPGEDHRRALIRRNYPSQFIETLPHSIDLERFHSASATDRDLDLVFVGRLTRSKQVDQILHALQRVVALRPRLIIVGDGPERVRLVELADELGLSDRVSFAGFRRDPSTYFRRAQAFVMASSREGLPFSLIEAMCSGTIPIVTSVGAIPEVVDDGKNGILVRPNDVDGLAAAISEVFSNPVLRDTLRNGALAVRDSYSYEAAAQTWRRALTQLETRSRRH
ncbi:MAG: glycosyltransferase [Acidimicrobiia bacterium]|nr:glycosyltransferase [Acidimicrobiia bacterium]